MSSDRDRARIAREIEALETLGQAVRWALARTPRAEFSHVVVQDEYTHDVIVRVDDDLFAVFDTT
ncbi:MAG: hypothetical protein QOE66_3267 [Chloroflexota bacterium]|nr:hypothetical protein [Chloroflexota bacterium]